MAALLVIQFPERAPEFFCTPGHYCKSRVELRRHLLGALWLAVSVGGLCTKNPELVSNRLLPIQWGIHQESSVNCLLHLRMPARWPRQFRVRQEPFQAMVWLVPGTSPNLANSTTDICTRPVPLTEVYCHFSEGRYKHTKCRFARLCRTRFAPHPSLSCLCSQSTSNLAQDQSPHVFPCQESSQGTPQTGFRLNPPT